VTTNRNLDNKKETWPRTAVAVPRVILEKQADASKHINNCMSEIREMSSIAHKRLQRFKPCMVQQPSNQLW